MKLLLVANFSSPRCGVKNWAEQCEKAFAYHAPEVTVVRYDATNGGTPSPQDCLPFDQVLYVWHPGPLSHLKDAIFPPRPRTSAWIAEVPPYATCPFLEKVGHVFAADPVEGRPDTTLLAYPVPDWPIDLSQLQTLPGAAPPIIGVTGIRGVGFEAVRQICERHQWAFSESMTSWIPIEQEIFRLSLSTINVCWYDAGRTEMASAPQTCLAARRPLLINNAPMLQHLFPYLAAYPGDRQWEIYGSRYSEEQDLEGSLVRMVEQRERLKVPRMAAADLAWGRMVGRMQTAWGWDR